MDAATTILFVAAAVGLVELANAAALGRHATLDTTRPNVVFLVVESTDGRTWTPGYQNGVLDEAIPSIRRMQAGGVYFQRHYSNAPVCCPSRATFWSGRHASNIMHQHGAMKVGGVYNNYEGLPDNYTNRIDQVMERAGYDVKMTGKYVHVHV